MALRLALGHPAFSSDQIGLMLQDRKAEKRDRVRTCFSHDHDEQIFCYCKVLQAKTSRKADEENYSRSPVLKIRADQIRSDKCCFWGWSFESNCDAGEASSFGQGRADGGSKRGELFMFPALAHRLFGRR